MMCACVHGMSDIGGRKRVRGHLRSCLLCERRIGGGLFHGVSIHKAAEELMDQVRARSPAPAAGTEAHRPA